MLLIRGDMEFSYNQFSVFDPAVDPGGSQWTAGHFNQGFARRDSAVSFGTLEQYGTSALSVFMASYSPRSEYQRVIEVPFRVVGTVIEIVGPEEVVIVERNIRLGVGDYSLTCAQWIPDPYGDEYPQYHLAIDLFFQKVDDPLVRSLIIIADAELSPPDPLVEWAESAIP